jgi:hypothetical protein
LTRWDLHRGSVDTLTVPAGYMSGAASIVRSTPLSELDSGLAAPAWSLLYPAWVCLSCRSLSAGPPVLCAAFLVVAKPITLLVVAGSIHDCGLFEPLVAGASHLGRCSDSLPCPSPTSVSSPKGATTPPASLSSTDVILDP